MTTCVIVRASSNYAGVWAAAMYTKYGGRDAMLVQTRDWSSLNKATLLTIKGKDVVVIGDHYHGAALASIHAAAKSVNVVDDLSPCWTIKDKCTPLEWQIGNLLDHATGHLGYPSKRVLDFMRGVSIHEMTNKINQLHAIENVDDCIQLGATIRVSSSSP